MRMVRWVGHVAPIVSKLKGKRPLRRIAVNERIIFSCTGGGGSVVKYRRGFGLQPGVIRLDYKPQQITVP
jgi:hypothetical protein